MRAGFLGAGHIARALAEGWRRDAPARSGGCVPVARSRLRLRCPNGRADVRGRLRRRGLRFAGRAREPAARSSCWPCVRPTCAAALAAVAPVLEGRALLSLAAAVPLDELRAGLPAAARVARLMPNVAAAVGRGVFLLAAGTLTARAGRRRCATCSAWPGTVVEIPESLFDPATAVAGCGPGFTALFIEALAEAGVKAGLERSDWPASSRWPAWPARPPSWRATATR